METNVTEKGENVVAVPDVKVVSHNDPCNSQPLIEKKQVFKNIIYFAILFSNFLLMSIALQANFCNEFETYQLYFCGYFWIIIIFQYYLDQYYF